MKQNVMRMRGILMTDLGRHLRAVRRTEIQTPLQTLVPRPRRLNPPDERPELQISEICGTVRLFPVEMCRLGQLRLCRRHFHAFHCIAMRLGGALRSHRLPLRRVDALGIEGAHPPRVRATVRQCLPLALLRLALRRRFSYDGATGIPRTRFSLALALHVGKCSYGLHHDWTAPNSPLNRGCESQQNRFLTQMMPGCLRRWLLLRLDGYQHRPPQHRR